MPVEPLQHLANKQLRGGVMFESMTNEQKNHSAIVRGSRSIPTRRHLHHYTQPAVAWSVDVVPADHSVLAWVSCYREGCVTHGS